MRNTMGKIEIKVVDKPKELSVSNAGQIMVLLFLQINKLLHQ